MPNYTLKDATTNALLDASMDPEYILNLLLSTPNSIIYDIDDKPFMYNM